MPVKSSNKTPVKNKKEKPLTPKQKAFCREYVIEWNATRSYLTAYPNTKREANAASMASRMLRNVKVQEYVTEIQKDLEKLCGISKAKVLNEHKKLAYSSIAHLHNTWIERKEFETLTIDQKSCIAEIDTKIQRKIEWEWDDAAGKKMPVPWEVEYVRIKLYDKQKALDSISKMMGYEAPNKTEITGKDGKELLLKMTDEDLEKRITELEKKAK